MDKLALIKQKYGYVSNGETNQTSKPLAGKENVSAVRAQSQRKENSYIIPKLSTERKQQRENNTKLVSQFCPPLPASAQETKHLTSTRQPLKQFQPNQNEKVNVNQSIVKSYEKTYDLLKNYRNRILLDSQNGKAQSQKKLILNPLSQIQIQMQAEQNDRERTESFVASQVSQRMEKRSYPKRCSPLQGIDLKGSCNVYSEIDNISRLQNRIHQIIGERPIR